MRVSFLRKRRALADIHIHILYLKRFETWCFGGNRRFVASVFVNTYLIKERELDTIANVFTGADVGLRHALSGTASPKSNLPDRCDASSFVPSTRSICNKGRRG